MSKAKQINILVIGGSGHWANLNYYNNIINFRRKESKIIIKVRAIIDTQNPYKQNTKSNLKKILVEDNPVWINPLDYKCIKQVFSKINELDIEIAIISSPPILHYEYLTFCIKNNIDTICDKPITCSFGSSNNQIKATSIFRKYKKIVKLYEKQLRVNPNLNIVTILRRRGLKCFTEIADEISSNHDRYGVGLNNMTLNVNASKLLYPSEILHNGAHGLCYGVGSLSHSAYHYIDLIAWFVSIAPGDAKYLKISLNYAYRLKDYLFNKDYKTIGKINNENIKAYNPNFLLSKQTLNTELNTVYNLELLNSNRKKIGNILFSYNQVGFSPRTNPYNGSWDDPANVHGGGRMSSFIFNIHQGGILSCLIQKNDIVFEGYEIRSEVRRHPNTAVNKKKEHETFLYKDPYNSGTTLNNAFSDFVFYVSRKKKIINHPIIRSIKSERLSMGIYAKFYELISQPWPVKRFMKIK